MLSAWLTVRCGITAKPQGGVGLNMDVGSTQLKHQCDGLDVQATGLTGQRPLELLARVCMVHACM